MDKVNNLFDIASTTLITILPFAAILIIIFAPPVTTLLTICTGLLVLCISEC